MPFCPHIPRDRLRAAPCQRCELCPGWIDHDGRVMTDAEAARAYPQIAPTIALYPIAPAQPESTGAGRVFAFIAAAGAVAGYLLVFMVTLPIAAAVLYLVWSLALH